MAHAGGRLAAEEVEGDRPSASHFRTLNLCLGSRYRLVIGNPYEAALRDGLRVWRALADREEGCPDEEISPASSPVSMAALSSAHACSAANAVDQND
jgi:hypothetical protein